MAIKTRNGQFQKNIPFIILQIFKEKLSTALELRNQVELYFLDLNLNLK